MIFTLLLVKIETVLNNRIHKHVYIHPQGKSAVTCHVTLEKSIIYLCKNEIKKSNYMLVFENSCHCMDLGKALL